MLHSLRLLSLFGIMFIAAFGLKAQTTDMGFTFQGYAVDADGKALGNKNITVKFTIQPANFIEEQNTTTDAFGVFTLVVGNKDATSKQSFQQINFTQIDATTPVYQSLKVEVKETSGGTYTTIHDGQMNSVPYARHAQNGVPVGTIIPFAGPTTKIPYGWVLCDGATKDGTSAQWKQLFDVIGTTWGGTGTNYNLPDLEGYFLRGAGTSTVDPNSPRALGSTQNEDYKSHNHSASQASHNHTTSDGFWSEAQNAPANTVGYSFNPTDTDNNGGGLGSDGGDGDNWIWTRTVTSSSATPAVTVNNNGGTETRPDNKAVNYIIKY